MLTKKMLDCRTPVVQTEHDVYAYSDPSDQGQGHNIVAETSSLAIGFVCHSSLLSIFKLSCS